MTIRSAIGATAVLILSLGAAMPALAYQGEKLASHVKITIVQARAIALTVRPGRITDEELERENGGSGYRYSFDIRHGSKTFEVGVDAQTGKVLENALEGPHPD